MQEQLQTIFLYRLTKWSNSLLHTPIEERLARRRFSRETSQNYCQWISCRAISRRECCAIAHNMFRISLAKIWGVDEWGLFSAISRREYFAITLIRFRFSLEKGGEMNGQTMRSLIRSASRSPCGRSHDLES
jgi:hypothetical protein